MKVTLYVVVCIDGQPKVWPEHYIAKTSKQPLCFGMPRDEAYSEAQRLAQEWNS